MNDKIEKSVCGILDKYEKEYQAQGVTANLQDWERNKSALISLLRSHPNWVENELAVIFDITENRDIDVYDVQNHLASLTSLEYVLHLPETDRENLKNALNHAICAATPNSFTRTKLLRRLNQNAA